ELRGRIRVSKNIDKDIELTGATEIVRGWVGFQGRRFNLSRGRIQFTGGGKIDPTLDIVAEHRLPQYQVNALVGGTAQSPTLRLTSSPQLEQSDILALLLFGKPVSALNQSQQTSLKQNALEVTSGFVAAKIGAAVSEALGLQNLGLDAGDVDFDGGKIGFGRYIGRDTYVSASQELAGERGREVSIEYQLAPDWKIGTSTNTQGSSGADIIWSKQY
ncbi:MAG: translocation/assembly module TamB, partial [Deltaproteobacteria bacterium]|nr:translocation/assembly module TamB [Deltaproteobacteria bacterium]